MKKRTKVIGSLILFGLLAFSNKVVAQNLQDEINWIAGPERVDIGKNLAQLDLTEEVVFVNGHDAKIIMEMIGNPPSEREVGLVMPMDQSQGWFVVFEYHGLGYIRDDEAGELDAEAILKSIKMGTEAANKIREENGQSPIHVIGWDEEPHYDPVSHNLVWSILGESEGEKIINYNTRLLGRKGYISATLVTEPFTFGLAKPHLETIIENLFYKKGMRYADFVPGKDKVAEYGLTALVAGGAGAAAAKAVKIGLFAKFWKIILSVLLVGKKFIAIAFLSLFALLGRFFKGKQDVLQ